MERKTELLQKLLRKAEDASATPEERLTITARVAELSIKWGIEEASLRAQGRLFESVTAEVIDTECHAALSGSYATLAVVVAEYLGCRGFLRDENGRTVAVVVGFPADLERVFSLSQSVALQASLGSASYLQSSHFTHLFGDTLRRHVVKPFLDGFRLGVEDRISAARSSAQASTHPGAQLALSQRTEQINTFVAEHMAVGPSKTLKVSSSQAVRAGVLAGLRADLGGNVLPC